MRDERYEPRNRDECRREDVLGGKVYVGEVDIGETDGARPRARAGGHRDGIDMHRRDPGDNRSVVLAIDGQGDVLPGLRETAAMIVFTRQEAEGRGDVVTGPKIIEGSLVIADDPVIVIDLEKLRLPVVNDLPKPSLLQCSVVMLAEVQTDRGAAAREEGFGRLQAERASEIRLQDVRVLRVNADIVGDAQTDRLRACRVAFGDGRRICHREG